MQVRSRYFRIHTALLLSHFYKPNIGIQPDIYMDKFVEDWVKYAQDYLENE